MINKKDRKQIVFDVSPELHKQIKILAAMRNISMNLFIHRAIIDRIAKENRDEKSEII